jgi:hypothetical protein
MTTLTAFFFTYPIPWRLTFFHLFMEQHYLRVYIYAFAFQAHVQRCTTTTPSGKKVADAVIFPRGPMGSPDARFILEAIDAAVCFELYPHCIAICGTEEIVMLVDRVDQALRECFGS